MTHRPADFRAFPADAVEGTIWSRFCIVATADPGKAAIIGPHRTLTYREAMTLAAGSGAELHASVGAGPEPIALLFAHDVDLVVAVLAVLAAGRPMLVLDPDAPIEVNRTVVADAGPAVLLFGPGQEARATEVAGVTPLALWSERAGDPGPLPAGDPGDPAMLAYTSGTTSEPKAAVLSHRALLHLARSAIDVLAIAPSDRLPMLFPISLAVAAYPMFLPLLIGGTLCVFDMRSVGLAPFPSWLAEHEISVIYFSPTVARFLGDITPGLTFPHLRLVVLGGERVDDDALRIIRQQFGSHVQLGIGYGTTETGVLTFFFADPEATYGPDGVPVGRAIPGVDLTLRSVDGLAVPDGASGEIIVTSRYLFDGYRNLPVGTARVLTPASPTSPASYRTGDVGRFDAQGSLVLVGRADEQVKVKGHRVVPSEVEHALLSLAEVSDAVVEARPDEDSTNRLVAWVVPTAGATTGTIREALSGIVKAHLVPADIRALDALPLLPNGKLDRRALAERDDTRASRQGIVVEPRSDTERMVADLWSQVLGVRPIGIDEDFADLGGQSLELVRVIVLLEEEHGVQIPMGDLLDVSTIEQLAAVIDRRAGETGRRTTVHLVQAGDSGRPPLFFVHDLYGTSFVLRSLAPALGVDHPLYGFESPLLRGPKSPYHSLESLAMRYVADLREVQPEGPYHLAGYSFGGVLAFEMARQLDADGQRVAFLGVIDVGPGYRGRHYDPRKVLDKPWLEVPSGPPAGTSLARRARTFLELARNSPRTALEQALLASGLDRWTDPVQFRLDLRRQGQIHPGRRIWYAWRGHWELARSYDWAGRSYGGPLTLFWADESASSDGTMGWGPIVGGPLRIVRVPTGHETMLEPEGAPIIGALLRQELSVAGPSGG